MNYNKVMLSELFGQLSSLTVVACATIIRGLDLGTVTSFTGDKTAGIL